MDAVRDRSPTGLVGGVEKYFETSASDGKLAARSLSPLRAD